MGFKDLFAFKNRGQAVQTARRGLHPYSGWMNYSPLMPPDWALYDALREAIPVIDAALDKIVRLTCGFTVCCQDPEAQNELDEFVSGVRVGASSRGLHQFVSTYLHSLLTYGNAVGEIIPTGDGENIYGLYNASLRDVQIKQGDSPLEAVICSAGDSMSPVPVRWPELVLFTPLNPPPGELRGVPLLRGLPFVGEILVKILNSVGTNFDRVGNLRYAVTYRPGNDRLDRAYAKEIVGDMAREWADVMSSQKSGVIKDFVAVGDVDVKVIGADNQMIETEIPVRQMLEQIIAKLGIPPFMLGLHWSSTERMSTQQADILTSELESYRTLLDGVICRICSLFLRLRGYSPDVTVAWQDINLQDEVESANIRLLHAQAQALERQMEGGNVPYDNNTR